MNLQEFYYAMGADYDVVLLRLQKEERIRKYLIMIASDPCFENLRQSMEKRDYKAAFQAAHTIKGMCLNLEIRSILIPLETLVEDLRRGGSEQSEPLFQQVWEQYTAMDEYIKILE